MGMPSLCKWAPKTPTCLCWSFLKKNKRKKTSGFITIDWSTLLCGRELYKQLPKRIKKKKHLAMCLWMMMMMMMTCGWWGKVTALIFSYLYAHLHYSYAGKSLILMYRIFSTVFSDFKTKIAVIIFLFCCNVNDWKSFSTEERSGVRPCLLIIYHFIWKLAGLGVLSTFRALFNNSINILLVCNLFYTGRLSMRTPTSQVHIKTFLFPLRIFQIVLILKHLLCVNYDL